MTRILALETSTKNCSVAIFENGKLIDAIEEGGAYSHAEKLALFVDQLLSRNKLDYQDLKAVAVSKGPGSYTGLRIGVSLAKGLCYSLSLPLISIETLQHMAWGARKEVKQEEAFYCPMIDARRMEVYAAIYNSDLELVKPTSADIIEEDSYRDFIAQKPVYFFGDGAEKCKEILKNERANFIHLNLPSSKSMGEIAQKNFVQNAFEDLAYFEPFYLKEFIAIKPKKLV
ncbi:MAG: tRNA (adenosine(37)-N6)-threonylcarbamoyltransferase complex dimerization subunit type 1 TsaB [Vicingaceae bacterium]